MIKGTFKDTSDVFEVIIDKNNLMFYKDGQITTLEGLRIDKSGVLKEFPDLKDNDDWKKIAIERLKENMKKMETEKEKLGYVKEELAKFGNKPLFFQKAGFRPEKFP